MAGKSIPPSIHETAFNCPHCGAFTTQHWLKLHADYLNDERRTPFLPDEDWKKQIISDKDLEPELRTAMIKFYNNMASGLVFLEQHDPWHYVKNEVKNLFLSQCFNCHQIAVWIHDKLLFPPERHGEQPHTELPQDVLQDYEEARSILNLSPRGSAALLRLCVQKLCIFLDEQGKNINDDIASLVQKGFPIQIQVLIR